MLYLRVNRRFIRLFPAATAENPTPPSIPLPPGTTGVLNIIIANLEDIQRFSGNTVHWLIAVMRLIFEPLGTGALYTFTTHTLDYWLEREMDDSQWRAVVPGEIMAATIYEFRPVNALITLTQISLTCQKSCTTHNSRDQSTRFLTNCTQRDQRCIISHHYRMKASHLIPKCLGDTGVNSIFQRFIGPPATADRYDPQIGVMVSPNLDDFVDAYEVGFWNIGPDQYVVHDFLNIPVNIFGSVPIPGIITPMCHGTHITLSDHGSSVLLPPVGVFNWHYIQCVLKKFATPDFRAVQNVACFMRPFSPDDNSDDSDRDFDDPRNIVNPPYPSYAFDLALARAHQHLDEAEQHQAILAWSTDVSANHD